MKKIAVPVGLFFLLWGLAYLYRPDLVIKFNALIRHFIFNDRLLILHRRRIGVVMLFIAFVLLFIGFSK